MSLDEALGIWAEAAQDLASASLSLAAGTYYNVADLTNQVAEKSLQAVYVLRHDARAPYKHDLRALGELVGAPPPVLEDLAAINPYHPAHFALIESDPAAADDAVGPDAADDLVKRARRVLKWARPYVLSAPL